MFSGSLALLADAGHMATDAVGIALALGAVTLAQRPARGRRTFGWQRAEILAAVANGLLLLAVAVYVVVAAVRRIGHPPDDRLGADAGRRLGRAGRQPGVAGACCTAAGSESLNVRGAYLEVLGDALGSVAVIVAAVVIALTGWTPADVVASVADRLPGPAAGLAPAAGGLRRPAGGGAPRAWTSTRCGPTCSGVDGVLGVHDLHAWTITSGLPVLSAHVVVTEEALAAGHGGRVLDALCACLGRALRRRALHVPAGGRDARRPRVARPRLKTAAPTRRAGQGAVPVVQRSATEDGGGGPRAALGHVGARRSRPPGGGCSSPHLAPESVLAVLSVVALLVYLAAVVRLAGPGSVALVADAVVVRRARPRCSPSPAPGSTATAWCCSACT